MYRCVFTERAFPVSSSNQKGPMMLCVLIAIHAVHLSELQDHVGRLASPVDMVLPIDTPKEVEMCFIRKIIVNPKVRHIFSSHISTLFCIK